MYHLGTIAFAFSFVIARAFGQTLHRGGGIFHSELREQDYLMLNKADSAIFFNESTNDSIKIIMCNNREFGAIHEKSYLHYVSCAIMYSTFSCFTRTTME